MGKGYLRLLFRRVVDVDFVDLRRQGWWFLSTKEEWYVSGDCIDCSFPSAVMFGTRLLMISRFVVEPPRWHVVLFRCPDLGVPLTRAVLGQVRIL